MPFITLGGGGLVDDVYCDHSQHLIGGGFEFSLVANGGLRFFVTPNVALNLTVNYEHTSNAGTSNRNLGVNALGGELGAGIFF